MLGYIDGSTGGMMLQLVMAGLVGGFVAIKVVMKSTLARFWGNHAEDEAQDAPILDGDADRRE